MKVKQVRYVGKADVYNMTVQDSHNFVIQGGAIAHNCDEIRYCCMQHIVSPRTIKEEYIPMADPLNQYRKTEKTAYIKYL